MLESLKKRIYSHSKIVISNIIFFIIKLPILLGALCSLCLLLHRNVSFWANNIPENSIDILQLKAA